MRLLLLLLFVPTLAFSQLRTITGRVVFEETKEPVPFAPVVLMYPGGAGDSLLKQGTNTNDNGQFSFSVNWDAPPDEFALLFSHIGCKTLVKRHRGSMLFDTLSLGPIGLESKPYTLGYEHWTVVRPVDKQPNSIQYLHREDLLNHPRR